MPSLLPRAPLSLQQPADNPRCRPRPTHYAPQCAEFYGREYVLFDGVSGQGSALTSLSQLLATVPGPKRVSILQHMTKACVPIMEKAILHPPMVHRLLRDLLECAPGEPCFIQNIHLSRVL